MSINYEDKDDDQGRSKEKMTNRYVQPPTFSSDSSDEGPDPFQYVPLSEMKNRKRKLITKKNEKPEAAVKPKDNKGDAEEKDVIKVEEKDVIKAEEKDVNTEAEERPPHRRC